MQRAQQHIEMLELPVRQLLEPGLTTTMNIVINCDTWSPLAEMPDADGVTPTAYTLKQQLADPRIQYHNCCDWGNNPGSCNALNQVIKHLPTGKSEDTFVLVFAKEALLDPAQVAQAYKMMQQYPQLAVVGFYRQFHWKFFPWRWPQNTAAMYRLKTLLDIGGFDRRCEGNDGTKIIVPTMADPVLLAGMDDFYFMLKALQLYNEPWFWSMVGAEAPFSWEVKGKTGLELKLHITKLARQEIVMEKWAQEIFPEIQFEEVINRLLAKQLLLPADPILLN